MSDIYLTRLIALRDIGFPLAEQKETEGHLDFNIFKSSCGTHGCLLGWWATTKYARKDGWRINNRFPYWNGIWTDPAEGYFGITNNDWTNLFGSDPKNTLAKRKAFLDALIQRRSTPNTP